MKTKPKLIICAVIFLTGAAVNVLFSTALHNILSGKMKTLAMTGFVEGIQSMAENGRHFKLFLCLQGFALILSVVFYLTNKRDDVAALLAAEAVKMRVAVGVDGKGGRFFRMERTQADIIMPAAY